MAVWWHVNNVDVEDDVIDGARREVIQQARNWMSTQVALLKSLRK